MSDLEPGYYWGHPLGHDGERLTTDERPTIFFLNSDGYLESMGWDLSVEYDPTRYELLERIEYQYKTPCQRCGLPTLFGVAYCTGCGLALTKPNP